MAASPEHVFADFYPDEPIPQDRRSIAGALRLITAPTGPGQLPPLPCKPATKHSLRPLASGSDRCGNGWLRVTRHKDQPDTFRAAESIRFCRK